MNSKPTTFSAETLKKKKIPFELLKVLQVVEALLWNSFSELFLALLWSFPWIGRKEQAAEWTLGRAERNGARSARVRCQIPVAVGESFLPDPWLPSPKINSIKARNKNKNQPKLIFNTWVIASCINEIFISDTFKSRFRISGTRFEYQRGHLRRHSRDSFRTWQDLGILRDSFKKWTGEIKSYLVISTAHALHSLAVGNFFSVRSRVAFLLLPFRFAVAALASLLTGPRRLALALQ